MNTFRIGFQVLAQAVLSPRLFLSRSFFSRSFLNRSFFIRAFFSTFFLSVGLGGVTMAQAQTSPETVSQQTTRTIASTNKPVQLVELYTSQGCYSCPPAERWMNKMTSSPDLWESLIPINLHVDYWDYIGWKDPFALKEFSSRQRKYERLGHTSNVATPGFVVNGEGWNGWFWRRSIPDASTFPGGPLALHISDQSFEVNYEPSKHSLKRLNAHVAILGFGIETEIPRGENAGKTLPHDFVVVGYQRALLRRSNLDWNKVINKPKTVDVPMTRQAVVTWVTADDDPKPLQVAAGWL